MDTDLPQQPELRSACGTTTWRWITTILIAGLTLPTSHSAPWKTCRRQPVGLVTTAAPFNPMRASRPRGTYNAAAKFTGVRRRFPGR